MTKPVIVLKNIYKVFERKDAPAISVLHNIDLEIIPNEIFVFVGPSGSGKSTILRIASGLEREYNGIVSFPSGITPRDISFVFQQFALLPWLTIYQNIALGLVARRVAEAEIKAKVSTELAEFGLEKFAEAYPRELSGGMRQRVGIARALATSPKIIFMDEPFSELDSFTSEELRKELLDIWAKRKPTIILVTHIVSEAIELADRIAVLTPRPGKIEKIVANHLPRPRAKRTEEFYRLEDQLTKLIRP